MSRSYIVMHSQRNLKLIRKKYSRVKVNRGFKKITIKLGSLKMKIGVNLKDKNCHREFIYSINKKTGLEQRFGACRNEIYLIRTDLNGKKGICVRAGIKKNSYDGDIRAYDLYTKKLEN